jgi:hypothetical protein
MSETAIIEALGVIFTVIGAIVSYFLAKTDKAQEDRLKQHEDIFKDLYKKHETDKDALVQLQLIVSDSYHKKPEIDQKVAHLERSIADGFKSLGDRFDTRLDSLLKAFTEHVGYERREKDRQ